MRETTKVILWNILFFFFLPTYGYFWKRVQEIGVANYHPVFVRYFPFVYGVVFGLFLFFLVKMIGEAGKAKKTKILVINCVLPIFLLGYQFFISPRLTSATPLDYIGYSDFISCTLLALNFGLYFLGGKTKATVN